MKTKSDSSSFRAGREGQALCLADVEAARRRLAHGLRLTPCAISPVLTEMLGRTIWLKRDDLQRTGSFKERGARHALLTLNEDERARGVIAASAGNHALGLAYHGAQLGVRVTVVMPLTATPLKSFPSPDWVPVLIAHLFCIGLPIALVVRWRERRQIAHHANPGNRKLGGVQGGAA